MHVGELDRLLTIQERVDTQNATTGIVTTTWPTFTTVWGKIVHLSAREFISADAQQSKIVGHAVIYRLSGLKPSMRIVDGSHTYQIEGELDFEKFRDREFITLPISEVVQG